MADTIICPLCGTENPSTQKVCQKCQTPLSGQSYQPGQAPGKKDTGELEPLLPQWLKEARESARLSESDPSEQPAEPTRQPAGVDFLAGLQSQNTGEDEEDVPDWLASITGTATPKRKTEEPETSGTRRVELGHKDDFPQEISANENDEMPPWLAGIQPTEAPSGGKDELTDWFRQSGEVPTQQPTSSISTPFPADDETQDWLKSLSGDSGDQTQGDLPLPSSFDSSDWFNQPSAKPAEAPLQPESAKPFDTASLPDTASLNDTPDWLRQMAADAETSAQVPVQPFEDSSSAADTPDWLSGLGGIGFSGEEAPAAEPVPAESEPVKSTTGSLPAWLNQDNSQPSDTSPAWLQEENKVDTGTPAVWLPDAEENQPAVFESEPAAQDDLLNDLPDWLKASAPQSSIEEPAPSSDAAANALKWFASTEAETPSQEVEPQKPATFEAAPAFSEDFTSSNSGDALFAEMPDWLSNAMDQPSSSVPAPMTNDDALASNELPSWVEAMRPSDTSDNNSLASAIAFANVSNAPLESGGALAGLQGVLPAGAGFAPTSKPKAYSIKLNANDEQLKHASILEAILAAETAPEAIETERKLGSSRVLRWVLAFILFAATFGTSFLGTRSFSMPLLPPNELKYAVAVAQAIPADAPVLVVFDYEPARAAEMEAAAAPLFDNMLLLKHPRLTFISSNEAGSILVERFMTGPLAVRNYQAGVTYVNLGYLSGGQLGIRAFAQNPSLAAPRDISLQPAWSLPPLQNVTLLNQFATIILVTDSAEAARAWVEQTEDVRAAAPIPIIVVASAQAAPMIQPYYESGQVTGMVSGLYGGALVEGQYNNGSPGTARVYWDAYSIGMFIAMIFVLGGGLISLALGLRDRAATRRGA